ncbi:MAG: hypothetical protein ACM3N9_04910 [Syntrophothermus sp.]
MGKSKNEIQNPNKLRSIYVCHSGERYGIVYGHNDHQEFHEQPKSIELWKNDGNERTIMKRFHKRHIMFVEYDDNPLMWVHPRPYRKAK